MNYSVLPASCAVILAGDVDYQDRETVIRTARMVLAYQSLLVLHQHNPVGAVAHALEFLKRVEHPRVSYGSCREPEDMVVAALGWAKQGTCRLCCLAYWNGDEGKNEHTLSVMRAVARAGIEMAVIPCERGWEQVPRSRGPFPYEPASEEQTMKEKP